MEARESREEDLATKSRNSGIILELLSGRYIEVPYNLDTPKIFQWRVSLVSDQNNIQSVTVLESARDAAGDLGASLSFEARMFRILRIILRAFKVPSRSIKVVA